jgi:hypothetical protein
MAFAPLHYRPTLGATPLAAAASPCFESAKPKLLYFRPRYGPTIPEFLRIHRDEHLKCLSQFFDLVVIEDDCDLHEACDNHEPAACLTEIGLQLWDARQPRITNLARSAGVPIIALVNADPWGQTRSRINAEVQLHEFDAVFSTCTTAGEHFPHIHNKLFYWPNFIDADVFSDLPSIKEEVVLFTGFAAAQYPWRTSVWNAIGTKFTVSKLPHAGYSGRAQTGHMVSGSNYARRIAGAWFAPTCGTVANELVRKHLEIPAAGTCLITQASRTLELAGFSDMNSAVFATPGDVVDKMEHLLSDPDSLLQIILKGRELVLQRHTMRKRSQILDWLNLTQAAATDRLVQPNPYGPIVLARDNEATQHVKGSGEHLRLLRQSVELVNAGQHAQALPVLEECKRLMPIMVDIDVVRARCALLSGKPEVALQLLTPILRTSLDSSDTLPPDPVEWAHFIIVLLALGRTRSALRRALEFSDVAHPQLDRARAAVFFLCRRLPVVVEQRPVTSLHRIEEGSVADWMESLRTMLTRCGQSRLAQRLAAGPWAFTTSVNEVFVPPFQRDGRWRRARPAISRRLRRWDNPLVRSALLWRARSLFSRR